jgi:hypothetical protein
MLRRYWFKTTRGLGYGVTATSATDARELLAHYGYPRSDEEIAGIIEDVALDALDASHVLPNAGPVVIRGVWYPRHNV